MVKRADKWSILRRIAKSGALSAFAMNACLFLLPLAGAALLTTFSSPQVFGYQPTAVALAATRADIEAAVTKLLTPGLDRRRAWEALVARELGGGDPHAARGFVLSARTILGGSHINAIESLLGPDPTDAEIAAASATQLSNETRDAFSQAAGWMAQSDARPDPAAFLVFASARDFADQAEAWLAGHDSDHLALVLTGLHVAYGRRLPPRIALGASALKDARRADRLRPELARALEHNAALAAPPNRLRALLSAAMAQSAWLTDGGASAAAAFRSAIDSSGYRTLAERLAEIGDMAAATSSRGAGRLLAQARHRDDLPRLRLVAQAGGDRAVAVAKRAPPDGEPMANLAHGTITWSQPLVWQLIAFAFVVLAMLAASATALTLAAIGFYERHRKR